MTIVTGWHRRVQVQTGRSSRTSCEAVTAGAIRGGAHGTGVGQAVVGGNGSF